MPITTPFHSRTAALCKSNEWREWSGYLAASTYGVTHEYEYYAVRNAAGLIDVSPLFKYEITGPDALRLVDRIMTRDITRCKVGQVMYSPWCDEDGKVIDDGTISRLEEQRFRVTSADPSLRWFQDCGYGMDVDVKDVSTQLAALAVQGLHSRDILKRVVKQANLDTLRYYWLAEAEMNGFPITVTRTGYTGDLGYELWVAPEHAETLWDTLMDAGHDYGIAATGLVALDMLRIEAGLLLIEIDYISAQKAVIESQKCSPYEIGLGWAVKLDGEDFIGRRALIEEQKRGRTWEFVGFEIDWPSLEELFGEWDLPPKVPNRASRSAIPIYKNGRQIGQATSITFSPLLKKFIAIGTVELPYAQLGAVVDVEITVEFNRLKGKAKLVKLPFFEPERKRAVAHG